MHRWATAFTTADLHSLAREPDPTAPGRDAHVNFDMILRRCGQAWMEMLDATGAFGTGVIVPHLSVDYLREVVVGPVECRVGVLGLGRTSLRVRVELLQHDEVAARTEAVLVSFDYPAGRPLPLTDAQRAALQPHLLAAEPAG